jgi:hypothetical protein
MQERRFRPVAEVEAERLAEEKRRLEEEQEDAPPEDLPYA